MALMAGVVILAAALFLAYAARIFPGVVHADSFQDVHARLCPSRGGGGDRNAERYSLHFEAGACRFTDNDPVYSHTNWPGDGLCGALHDPGSGSTRGGNGIYTSKHG